MDQPRNSAEDFGRAIARDPEDIESLLNRAILYRDLGEADKAVQDCGAVPAGTRTTHGRYQPRSWASPTPSEEHEGPLSDREGQNSGCPLEGVRRLSLVARPQLHHKADKPNLSQK